MIFFYFSVTLFILSILTVYGCAFYANRYTMRDDATYTMLTRNVGPVAALVNMASSALVIGSGIFALIY